MNRILKFSINCGDTTCASEPGEFCKYLGSTKFGTVSVCMLIPDPDPTSKNKSGHTYLKVAKGGIQRCPECLDREDL